MPLSPTESASLSRLMGHLIAGRPIPDAWWPGDEGGWQAFLAHADDEGVAPLLARVAGHPPHAARIPEAVRRRLSRALYATTGYNEVLFVELARLTAALGEHGIPTIPVKGAYFAWHLYESPGLRPMHDLDVLIPVDRVDEAEELARELGYLPVAPEPFPGANRILGHDVHLERREAPAVAVELHWSVGYGVHDARVPPPDWFWANSTAWPACGSGPALHPLTRALGLDAQIVLAVLHAASHARVGLHWLHDLRLLLAPAGAPAPGGASGWMTAIDGFGWTEHARSMLEAIERDFGDAMSPEIRGALTIASGARPAGHPATPPPSELRLSARRWWASNWRARVAHLRVSFWPSIEYLRHRYPEKRAWPAMALRLYRWGEGVRRMAQGTTLR